MAAIRRQPLIQQIRLVLDHQGGHTPNWLALSALGRIRESLESLHRYVDAPEEPAVGWASPWVEAQCPVDWDWDTYQPPAPEADTEAQADVARRIEAATADRNSLGIPCVLTHGAALTKRANALAYLLTDIYEPFIFTGTDESELTLDLDNRLCRLPALAFRGGSCSRHASGVVTAQFQPLVIDEDGGRVYYPVMVGITIMGQEADEMASAAALASRP